MHRTVVRPFGFGDFVRVVLRHKTKVLLWCGLVGTLSIASLAFLPRKYESEAKLFVRLGRESVTLDPTATTGPTIQVQESRENQLNSTRDMLKSRALLERVVELVGAEKILAGSEASGEASRPGLLAQLKHAASWLKLSSPASPAERAVNSLSNSITVTLARNSSVISLTSTAGSPHLAQEIMRAFVEACQEQHAAANRTSGSLEFFSGQTAQLKQGLDTTLAKLRDAKNESGLVSIAAEQKALQDQLISIEAASLATDASLNSSQASITSLRKAVKELPEELTTEQTTGFPNAAADAMKQEFFKLTILIQELEAKLGDSHPLVKVQQKQAQQLQAILNEQAVDRVQTTTGINPARQSLDLDLRREEALVASLGAKSTAIKGQYADLQKRLHVLNEHEVRIAELQRQAEIGEANYRIYADHLEQARIVQALEANRISNINIVQPPSLVEKAISPKPVLIVGLGLFTALCGALVLPFGTEYLSNSRRLTWANDSQPAMPGLAPAHTRGAPASLNC